MWRSSAALMNRSLTRKVGGGGFQPFVVMRYEDGLLVTEERHFDQLGGRTVVRVTLLYPDGRRTELGHAARTYTLTELARMLARRGLQLQTTYGGLSGSPLTLDSRRLVVIADKSASPQSIQLTE